MDATEVRVLARTHLGSLRLWIDQSNLNLRDQSEGVCFAVAKSWLDARRIAEAEEARYLAEFSVGYDRVKGKFVDKMPKRLIDRQGKSYGEKLEMISTLTSSLLTRFTCDLRDRYTSALLAAGSLTNDVLFADVTSDAQIDSFARLLEWQIAATELDGEYSRRHETVVDEAQGVVTGLIATEVNRLLGMFPADGNLSLLIGLFFRGGGGHAIAVSQRSRPTRVGMSYDFIDANTGILSFNSTLDLRGFLTAYLARMYYDPAGLWTRYGRVWLLPPQNDNAFSVAADAATRIGAATVHAVETAFNVVPMDPTAYLRQHYNTKIKQKALSIRNAVNSLLPATGAKLTAAGLLAPRLQPTDPTSLDDHRRQATTIIDDAWFGMLFDRFVPAFVSGNEYDDFFRYAKANFRQDWRKLTLMNRPVP